MKGVFFLTPNRIGAKRGDWCFVLIFQVWSIWRAPRRKNRPKHEAPLQDAQRALGLTRHNAKAWWIDPKRIGILGFSAGGHLAATAMTNFQKRIYPAVDAAEKASCRPDFAILVYPAYLVDNPTRTKLVPEVPVDKNTPSTIFIHAGNDPISADGSLNGIASIDKDGERIDTPKEDQVTIQKIK